MSMAGVILVEPPHMIELKGLDSADLNLQLYPNNTDPSAIANVDEC